MPPTRLLTTALTDLGRFSGAVRIARGDEVLIRAGYGYRDIEARAPFTPETYVLLSFLERDEPPR